MGHNFVNTIDRSEGRVPNGIFDPWVRWDGGLDSARNSSVAVAAAVAAAAAAVVTNYPVKYIKNQLSKSFRF